MPAIPANTKLLMHFNGDYTDAMGNHTPVNSNASIDTTNKKFGSGSAAFNNNTSRILIPAHADFDITYLTSTTWTWSMFVRLPNHAGNDHLFSRYTASGPYYLYFWHVHGTGLQLISVESGSTTISIAGGEIVDANQHHVVLTKIAGTPVKWAFYLDGAQTAYSEDSSFGSQLMNAYLGSNGNDGENTLDGNIDEFIVVAGNPFNASPVAGLTDTITVPTSEWGELAIIVNDSITISESNSSSVPFLPINTYDSIIITENVSLNAYFETSINVFDSIAISEDLTVKIDLGDINVNDQISITENIQPELNNFISVSDSITISEDTAFELVFGIEVFDSIAISENYSVINENLGGINVNDQISVVENINKEVNSFISVSDEISITENVMTDIGLNISVSDSITISENLGKLTEYFINVNDSIAITENIQKDIPVNINKYDSISISESITVSMVWDEPSNIKGRVMSENIIGRVIGKY